MLDSKLNLDHLDMKSNKNYKIRQMAWITNTIEDDNKILEEMFWPTKEEKFENKRRNLAAKEWLINERK